MKNIVIAVAGASGSLYARSLITALSACSADLSLHLVFSREARSIWEEELGETPRFPDRIRCYDNADFHCPFASGSTPADAMIIIPCSTGCMGRIASGISSDLIGRIADVQLKERRELLVVLRETPLNTIHIRNMLTLSECGATIFPAAPPLYNSPDSIEEMTRMFAGRIMDYLRLPVTAESHRWSGPHP